MHVQKKFFYFLNSKSKNVNNISLLLTLLQIIQRYSRWRRLRRRCRRSWSRGGRYLKHRALIGQELQRSSSCSIRTTELYLLSNCNNNCNNRPPLSWSICWTQRMRRRPRILIRREVHLRSSDWTRATVLWNVSSTEKFRIRFRIN